MSVVLRAIREQGVVGIVRAADEHEASHTLGVLMESGLRVLEVSLVTPGAFDVIRTAVAEAPDGVHIGVGTVLTLEQVSRSAEAGAAFVVSPVVNERVLKASRDLGLDTLPGVATPSEALQALEWGSTMVKLFPASLWSPTALRDVLSALPDLETVPTGGIRIESVPEWIRNGATAVGMGSSLTKTGDPSASVRALLSEISLARK